MKMPMKRGLVLGRGAPCSIAQGRCVLRQVIRRINPDYSFKPAYFWRRRGKQMHRAESTSGFQQRLLFRLRSNVWG